MSIWPTRLAPLLARPDLRLAGFGVSALLAVYLGFLGIPVARAEDFLKRGGYYLMLATVALFIGSIVRVWRLPRLPLAPLTRREKVIAAVAIALLALMAFGAEPYRSKILNDEFVLQSTAFNMHFFRDVATMVRGYDIQGVFLSTDNYLDKRPYFYPFAVSLLHDLTGYRPANAHVVNTLLMPLALSLAFAFGRRLHGWRGGMLAVLLLGSLPLLGQNATGSGMELLNTVMILAAMLLCADYLAAPSDARLSAFLLAIVLLAQSRYESALYVVSAALGVAIVGWRTRQVRLSWTAALVPLLLLPVALQNKVLSNSPVLWELNEKSTSRFDYHYMAENMRGALLFLFNRDGERANSLTLSVLGLLGLGWAAWRLMVVIRRGGQTSPARLALACFGVAIFASTVLVFCYYWARFDDPMASRFSLPLHLLMTFAAVLLAGALDRRLPVTPALLLLVSLVSVPFAAGKFGHHYYSHLGIDEVEWQRRFVRALPPAERLIVTNFSTLPWLLDKKPSILIGRARLVADRLHHQLHAPTFQEILVLQTLRPGSADGDHQLPADDKLPAYFKLELMAEKRFGTRLSRISRLVAVELPPEWTAPAKKPVARSTRVTGE